MRPTEVVPSPSRPPQPPPSEGLTLGSPSLALPSCVAFRVSGAVPLVGLGGVPRCSSLR